MALSDFRQLLEYYDGELISAATFMYRWFDLRKLDRTWMGPAEDPLSQVFLALDDYVPDTGQERTEGTIDERQLREIVHRSLAQISNIDDSEARRFDISRDVVTGLADADPEIRSYAAVIAREFPGDPVVIDALRGRLTDPDNPVRRMAVESLGQLGDVGSFDAILQVLESADDPFSEASAVASLAAKEPSLRPRARAAITSWAKRRSSPFTDENLALYLRQIGDDDD
jgi:hypothetical protein